MLASSGTGRLQGPAKLDRLARDGHRASTLLRTPSSRYGRAAFRRSGPNVVALATANGGIVDETGKQTSLKGINWFGFNSSDQGMVQGLWFGQSALTQDFRTVVWRLKLLGFNTVRLPLNFGILNQSSVPIATRNTQPVSLADIAQSVMPPDVYHLLTAKGVDVTPPALPAYGPTGTPTVACEFVPNDSIFNRIVYVAQYLADNGMNVVLTNHIDQDRTVLDRPSDWVTSWQRLVSAIIAGPNSETYQRRVVVDLANEPDSQGLSWEDMHPHYIAAMEAIHQVSPTTLFFIEGTGQTGLADCWGDGFFTDDALIRQASWGKVSDPKPFLTDVLSKPYANNVVLSPHIYPPSIADARSQKPSGYYEGPQMWPRLNQSFGTLAQTGFNGHKFPICIGETGSFYDFSLKENKDLPGDRAFLETFAQWLNNEGAAGDGSHPVIDCLLWWTWSTNSGDTGGLIDDKNPTQLLWHKIMWLQRAIKLSPWYLSLVPVSSS